MALHVLNDSDMRVLQGVIDREKRQLRNTSGRAAVVELPGQAPDVYVVLTPPSGIAARIGNTLGHSTCSVFQEVNGVLTSSGFQQQVFNHHESDIDGNTYITAKRDKFGTWLADQDVSLSAEDPDLVCVSIYDVCEHRNRYFYLPDKSESDLPCLPCDEAGTSTIPSIFTGTSTTTGPCGGCTDVECYKVTGFTGLTNVGCLTCTSITLTPTTLILEKAICTWIGTFVGCAISESSFATFGYHNNGLWVLTVWENGEVARYETINSTWNCSSILTLVRVLPIGSGADANGYCANYPSVVFIEPCSTIGTGTGHPPPPPPGTSTSTSPVSDPPPSCGGVVPPTVTRNNTTKCRYATCTATVTSPYYTGAGCVAVTHSAIGACGARMTLRDGDGTIIFDDMIAGSGGPAFTPVHMIQGPVFSSDTVTVFSLAQFLSQTYATGALTSVLTLYDAVGGYASSSQRQVATILDCGAGTGTGGGACPASSATCAGANTLPFNTNCSYDIPAGTTQNFKFTLQSGFTYTLTFTPNTPLTTPTANGKHGACGSLSTDFGPITSGTGVWSAVGSDTQAIIEVNADPMLDSNYTIRVVRT